MGKSRSAAVLDKLIQQRVASEQFGRHLLDQTGASVKIGEAKKEATEAKQAVEAAQIPINDGIPPSAPTTVIASVFFRDVLIGWDVPLSGESVTRTKVTVKLTSDGTVVSTHETKDITLLISGLTPGTSYTFDVQHIDAFDLISAATTVTAIPEPTVAERITSATAVAAGQVSNLLNDPGLAAITDPTKLADATVRTASMLMSNNPNLLTWDHAEFANLAIGATIGNNSVGITNAVVQHNTRNWLNITLAAGNATGRHIRTATFVDRTDAVNGWYIWSAEVYNPGTTDMNVALEVERGNANALVDTSTGNTFVVPPKEKRQVYIRFQRTDTATQQRIALRLYTVGSVYLNRYMLQRATSNSTEPSAYAPPGLSTGVVAADLLSAWSLTAGRAIIADATINDLKVAAGAINDLKFDRASGNRIKILSADIDSITANKITTGTLTATVGINTGGLLSISGTGKMRVISGGTEDVTIDSAGVGLRPTAAFRDAANNDRNAKITPISGNPKMAFSLLDNASRMGMYLRAEGTGTQAATIALDALNGTLSDVSVMPGILIEAGVGVTNRIQLSGPRIDVSTDSFLVHSTTVNFDNGLTSNKQVLITGGGLDLAGASVFRGNINMLANFTGTTTFGTIEAVGNILATKFIPQFAGQGNISGASGSFLQITHNIGTLPSVVMGYVDTTGNGNYRPISGQAGYTELVNANIYRVTNTSSSAGYVHLRVYT